MVLEMPSENRQCQCRWNMWLGSLFQTRDAVDEKDFEVAIDVCLMWTLKSKITLVYLSWIFEVYVWSLLMSELNSRLIGPSCDLCRGEGLGYGDWLILA